MEAKKNRYHYDVKNCHYCPGKRNDDVAFGDRHSFRDWQLLLSKRPEISPGILLRRLPLVHSNPAGIIIIRGFIRNDLHVLPMKKVLNIGIQVRPLPPGFYSDKCKFNCPCPVLDIPGQ